MLTETGEYGKIILIILLKVVSLGKDFSILVFLEQITKGIALDAGTIANVHNANVKAVRDGWLTEEISALEIFHVSGDISKSAISKCGSSYSTDTY